MIIYYFVLFFIIIAFILASIEDIKKKEVYDYLNFSLIFIILIISLFHSFITESFEPLRYVIFGLLIGFGLGSLMYYLGMWGGGDAKFLIGFGAASYYLLEFGEKNFNNLSLGFEFLILKIGEFLDIFLNFSLKFIYIDLFFIFLILFFIINNLFHKKFELIKDMSLLLFSLIFLFIGLNFNSYSPLILFFFGLISFFLIFFADEKIFSSIFIRFKKNLENLKEGDILDDGIKINGKTIIEKEKGIKGLDKEDLLSIKEILKETQKENLRIDLRFIFPFSIIVSINFFLYLIAIISFDSITLNLLSFLFKFLFFSIISGGVFALVLILYYYFKNIKKIKISFKWYEIALIFGIFVVGSLFFMINKLYSILFFMVLVIYILIKVSKKVENFAFITKKSISKIVPGDWIVEDIKIEEKLIYSKEDFKLGVNEDQLKKLKDLHEKNKLKSVLVKDGIAFLPPMFIAFIIMLII